MVDFKTIGVLGCGNMGAALVRALVSSGTAAPKDVLVYDTLPGAMEALKRDLGVEPVVQAHDLPDKCDVLILVSFGRVPPKEPRRIPIGLALTLASSALSPNDHARANAKTPLTYIASRNVRPLFVNREFSVCGEPSDDGKSAKLWVVDDQGALALSAEAKFK